MAPSLRNTSGRSDVTDVRSPLTTEPRVRGAVQPRSRTAAEPVFGGRVVAANSGALGLSVGHSLELRAQPPPVQDRAAPCLNSGDAEHRCQGEPGPRRRGLVRLVSDNAYAREKSCHRDGCQQPRHRHPLPRSWRHQLPVPPHCGDDDASLRGSRPETSTTEVSHRAGVRGYLPPPIGPCDLLRPITVPRLLLPLPRGRDRVHAV